ncbi:MAG: hypothetical protein HOB38_05300, partial [Deltaproteobacteria bacterium]|nr:hypothetical protein [Deltaproteobacteria bacterium]
ATSLVAGAAKKIDGLIFLGGFFVGVMLYAESFTLIFEPLLSVSYGKLTLNTLLGLPYGVVVLLVVFIALATFYIMGKFEGVLYKKK